MTQSFPPQRPSPSSRGPAPDNAGAFPKCKRAGVLICAVAVLLGLRGVAIIASSSEWPKNADLPADQLQKMEQMQKTMEAQGVSMKVVMIVFGLIITLPSVALLGLAPFVWRGNRPALLITAIVAAIVGLLCALLALAALVQGAGGAALVLAAFLGALILSITWLAQAFATAGNSQLAMMQQQMMYQRPQSTPASEPPPPPYAGFPAPPPGQAPISPPPPGPLILEPESSLSLAPPSSPPGDFGGTTSHGTPPQG